MQSLAPMALNQHWKLIQASGILRRFAGVAAMSATSKFLQVALTIILARGLSPEGYGVYIFATGAGLLGGRLGALGWPTLAVRFIPAYSESNEWGLLRGLLRQSEWVVGIAGITVAIGMYSVAQVLGTSSHLSRELTLAAILVPVMAYQSLRRNQLIGLNRPIFAIVVNEVLPPLLVLGSVLLLSIGTPNEAVFAYLAANGAAVVGGLIAVRKYTPAEAQSTTGQTQLSAWMKIALPSLVGMSGLLLMNKADVLMLAPLSTLEQVGFYGSAQRLTYLQAAPIILLSTLLSPRIAKAFAAKNRARVRQLLGYGLAFAAAVAIPIGLALAGLSRWVVHFAYASPYAEASPVLAILALGQIASALTIPTTSFLLMTGNQNRFGTGMSVALALNIGGNFWLIPLYGAVGAAFTTTVVMLFLFTLQISSCIRTLRRDDIWN